MGVTIKKSANQIPRLRKLLERLGKKEIKVGVFGEDNYQYENGADLVTIAGVHEYGMTIRPKQAKYLTIPLVPEAKGKRAGEFRDLVPIGLNDGGNGVLARVDGDNIQPVFALVKSVTIPERSFLRTGFDDNVEKIVDKIESMIFDVLDFNVNPDVFLDAIGMEFAGLIQKHMRGVNSPPNAAATKNVKGSSNPLQDTGRLIGAIRHEVE
jgi:hypothetical protein